MTAEITIMRTDMSRESAELLKAQCVAGTRLTPDKLSSIFDGANIVSLTFSPDLGKPWNWDWRQSPESTPPRQKWEYTTHIAIENSKMMELGAHGWELVAVNKGKFYFKRPVI